MEELDLEKAVEKIETIYSGKYINKYTLLKDILSKETLYENTIMSHAGIAVRKN